MLSLALDCSTNLGHKPVFYKQMGSLDLSVQDYRTFLDFAKAELGIEETDILDVPGNHDTLNVATR